MLSAAAHNVILAGVLCPVSWVLNPESVILFLVPCVSSFTLCYSREPLLPSHPIFSLFLNKFGLYPILLLSCLLCPVSWILLLESWILFLVPFCSHLLSAAFLYVIWTCVFSPVSWILNPVSYALRPHLLWCLQRSQPPSHCISIYCVLCTVSCVLNPVTWILNPESCFLCLLSSSTVMSATAEKPGPHPIFLSFVLCPVSCVLNPVTWILAMCLGSSVLCPVKWNLNPVSYALRPHLLWCLLQHWAPPIISLSYSVSFAQCPVSCVLLLESRILFLMPSVLISCDVCYGREARPPSHYLFPAGSNCPYFSSLESICPLLRL